MDIIKIIINKLIQEKIEKEFLLESTINKTTLTQLDDSVILIKELALLNNSISLLEAYLPKQELKDE